MQFVKRVQQLRWILSCEQAFESAYDNRTPLLKCKSSIDVQRKMAGRGERENRFALLCSYFIYVQMCIKP